MKYISSINSKINKVVKKHKLYSLLDVAYFILLLFGFHFVWKYWQNEFDFRFFTDKSIFILVYKFLTHITFYTTDVFLAAILEGHYYTENLTWYFDNGSSIEIVDGCSGLKAYIQFIIIILFFPGPIKSKFWFIPTGVIILFITNIIRVIGLDVIIYYFNSYWGIAHDHLQKAFFYGVIFLLWVIWVEKFKNRRQQ